ncbi:YciI family protein [Mucilaginibacter sp. UR6-1]|uniref:YciI family protein n=1 Tax=Mucilaginibacter sp. UR6-1 TaxID=1435643 RepID=UPI001E56954B|nr:YciI family protein [Mucilaginibacter sp. UR6-1]MCC8407388.1 YciI family protein [Mucilaginibacter sp. UR6-1]
MKQYVLTAFDHTDTDAIQRRLDVRPLHVERVKQLKASGNFIVGGAMLNDNGDMIGSTMIVQFDSDDELEQWKQSDPYVTGGVWDKIEVRPFKVANV